jgi:16S rRNA (cytosine1402-N4)-methyltransferase
MTVHIPVLKNEVLAALDPQPGNAVIDGTYGGGGHAQALLERIGAAGRLLAVDWSEHAVRECADAHANDSRVICAAGNFADLPDIARVSAFPKAHCLLLDLGISSDELEHSGKGFSFREDEPLIMTYSDAEEPVARLLAAMNEDGLARILKTYGEERFAGRIAKAVVRAQRANKIKTSKELADVVARAVPAAARRGRIHPATRTFMALRIYANRELENLERALDNLPHVVAPGGRVAVISFHSLEDRIVKHKFKTMERAGKATILTRRPIAPQKPEIQTNPRSRSAKLRACTLI